MEFDFTTVAIAFAGLSLGGIGLIMAGQFLWPDVAQRYKKQIPEVLIGLVLVAIAGGIVVYFKK